MYYKISDEVYDRIEKKVEDGIFTKGEDCRLNKYYSEKDISSFPLSERTPELCSCLMGYSRCRLSDVPESSRTREFFISSFTDNDVYDYIRNNIADFDRQFFKDLIASNEFATRFEDNCFSVMPIEYIDEEMCSLAILVSTNYGCDDWFLSVYQRKPEVLTADLWKLGARLYSRLFNGENEFLTITPEEYRDTEYYKEMCSCNFNCGMGLDTNKGKIMDSIPQEILTPKFLIELLLTNENNIARFSEKQLETEFKYIIGEEVVCENIWQVAIRFNGKTIENMKLNDERIEFFLRYYGKDSIEYECYFKDNYKKYIKGKNDAEALARIQQTTQEKTRNVVDRVLFSSSVYSMIGGDPTKAIEEENSRNEEMSLEFIPIKYWGRVPEDLCKQYDSEEYLALFYQAIGIKVVEEYDDLFYRVILPSGWSCDRDGYFNNVKDSNRDTIIRYFYGGNFYDKDANVRVINIPKEKISSLVERGKPLIFRQNHNNWIKMIESSANNLCHVLELSTALEIMEALDNGATMEEAVEIMSKRNYTDASTSIVRNIMFHFSMRGPEFCEATACGELDSEERIAIMYKKHENLLLLSKQHSKTQMKRLFKSIENRDIRIAGNISHLTLKEFQQFRDDLKQYTDEQIVAMYSPTVESKKLVKIN